MVTTGHKSWVNLCSKTMQITSKLLQSKYSCFSKHIGMWGITPALSKHVKAVNYLHTKKMQLHIFDKFLKLIDQLINCIKFCILAEKKRIRIIICKLPRKGKFQSMKGCILIVLETTTKNYFWNMFLRFLRKVLKKVFFFCPKVELPWCTISVLLVWRWWITDFLKWFLSSFMYLHIHMLINMVQFERTTTKIKKTVSSDTLEN